MEKVLLRKVNKFGINTERRTCNLKSNLKLDIFKFKTCQLSLSGSVLVQQSSIFLQLYISCNFKTLKNPSIFSNMKNSKTRISIFKF